METKKDKKKDEKEEKDEKKLEVIKFFVGVGLDERRAKEVSSNTNLSKFLMATFTNAKEYAKNEDISPFVNFLYSLGTSIRIVFFLILFDLISLFLAYESAPHLPILVKYIIDEKLTKNNLQLMIAFLKKLGPRPLDIKELEAESGIGKFQFFLNSLE